MGRVFANDPGNLGSINLQIIYIRLGYLLGNRVQKKFLEASLLKNANINV